MSPLAALAIDPLMERQHEQFAARPDQVSVVVAFSSSPFWQFASIQDVENSLRSQLSIAYSTTWSLTQYTRQLSTDDIALSPSLMTYLLDSVPASSLPTEKTFLIAIEYQSGQFPFHVVEYDHLLESQSDVYTHTSSDLRFLGQDLAIAIESTFRPLVKITASEKDQFTALMKTGEYIDSQSQLPRFTPGDLLTPINIYYDRKGVILKREPVPWTYLQVNSRDRAVVTGQIISAYSNVIGGSRRRIETYAVRQKANHPATTISFVRRDSIKSPLSGYLVKSTVHPHYQSVTADNSSPLPAPEILSEDYTNRQGKLTIPRNSKSPIQMVNVISGESILVRVPMLIGASPAWDLPVPNDLIRLAVEGQLQVLETELTDLVAHRAVLMATARKLAKSGKFDEVDKILLEMKNFPTARALKVELTAIRVNAVNKATEQRNRAAANKVESLCSKATELVEKYLGENVYQAFEDEIEEIKKTI